MIYSSLCLQLDWTANLNGSLEGISTLNSLQKLGKMWVGLLFNNLSEETSLLLVTLR
jgi:hypothetical protein